ncbi:hypothetical protein CAEBREN_25726 [Caenorhabditis brenneri]|uniref:Uncharacterized protein n=1 Tax=Caenorhabditis brenneri TaxID=135651 RepID=G0MBP0_CAEBE|nr:hypothetical protein CAEBREN_25726 [Caenorhabditis brenneri]
MTKPFADLIGKPEDQPKCPCEAQAQLTTISVKMNTANERIRRALPRVLKHYESRINSYRRQIILVMYVILVVNSWGTIVTLPWLNPVFPYTIVLMSYFAALALNIRMWKKWGFRAAKIDAAGELGAVEEQIVVHEEVVRTRKELVKGIKVKRAEIRILIRSEEQRPSGLSRERVVEAFEH